MAYSEALAQRVRMLLAGTPAVVEKKMFGGLSFMAQGNLAVGVIGDELIVRVGPERNTEALFQPHARPFDFSGRPMSGWVTVAAEGLNSDEALAEWVQQGVAFALTLPPK
ncbi:MAG: TfoX/Sxy family protein [Chloroflexota bacterium]